MSTTCCGPGPSLCFKRGSSFTARVTYVPPEGGLANLIGATVTSQIRRNGVHIADLDAEVAADGMSFTLTADEADTATWPVAALQWDIRIAYNDAVIYSETINLSVLYAVTQQVAAPLVIAPPTPEPALVAEEV